MPARSSSSGVVLLEAMVALALVGALALVLTTASRDALTVAARVRETERDVLAASDFLDAVAIWSAADLDRHLGIRRQGNWQMELTRDGPLYRVDLTDSTGARRLMSTTLYRTRSGGPSR